MTTEFPDRHLWIAAAPGDLGTPAAGLLRGLATPPCLLADIDGHSRLRGPFTAAGSLLRAVGADILARTPALARRYDTEILTAAPELSAVLQGSRETLTSQAPPATRTRFYPHVRAFRIGRGLTELMAKYASALGEPCAVIVRNADHAEPTDLDWLADMLRRCPPASLRIVVCTAADDAPEPLGDALRSYCDRISAPAQHPPAGRPGAAATDGQRRELAAAYVDGDCTSPDRRLEAAYQSLPAAERARLHDARAAELESRGEVSLLLGAISYHREHGSDPAGAGAAALSNAQQHCMMHGFNDAVLDLGQRCRALLDWATHPEDRWLATVKMAIAYQQMGRPDEAMAMYDEACAGSALPSIHMHSAYGRAMLYTRYYEPGRRDHAKAKAWVNTAIALSALSPDDKRRAYNRTFNENGLALIEMHLGDPAESLRRVEAGIMRLDATLGEGEQSPHRAVLKYNRAQLIARTGSPADAVAAYTEVIAEDPNHGEYYFERAALLRKAGRPREALADYREAARLDPPYPEPYYNRADLLLELGEAEDAIADLEYVIELDPANADAHINLAAARYEAGDATGTAAAVNAGLRLAPGEPHLLCLRGLIAQDAGELQAARRDFLAALDVAEDLAGAWAGLGVLAFDEGSPQQAVRHFDRSLALAEDPVVRANRETALQSVVS
jgi:tetratricopeptide (TPR) repeat protein